MNDKNYKKEIKAIVFDVDGTLTDYDRKMSIDSFNAVHYAEEQGIITLIASGNVLPITKAASMFLGSSGPIVAENGGMVEYNEKIIFLTKREISLAGYNEIKKYMNAVPVFADRWRESEVAIKLGPDINMIRRIVEPMGLAAENTGFSIHIMEKGVNKMSGIEKALELLGLTRNDVACIGDSENDIAMVRDCAVGIAVNNAVRELKEYADYICENSYGKGAYEAVRWLLDP